MVQGRETLVPVIIALDCIPVPDEGVEHHGCVHEGLIRALPSPHLFVGLQDGGGDDPFPDADTRAMRAVGAMAMHRYLTVSALDRHLVGRRVPEKGQVLHGTVIMEVPWDMRMSIPGPDP